MKPQLPAAEKLVPYLQRIDAARYYSNHGPLLMEFERRLAGHFGLDAGAVMTASNGTTALSAALIAVGREGAQKCLVPSWTFVASAAAIWAANLKPHFIDVDSETWMPDPGVLEQRTDLNDIAAVMVVSPFGAPVDVAAWDAFTARTGVPVLIDAAAAFDTVASVDASGPGRSLMMISLHATKVIGSGEGAIVLSRDETLVDRVRQVCNFGVWGPHAGQVLGYNGKVSEYHAAVGLAALDAWSERRRAYERLTKAYVDALTVLPGVNLLPRYGEGWVSCYCNVAVRGDAARVISALRADGIETRRWWRGGVHEQPAYRHFTRDGLPVTESLGATVFGVPFYHDISGDERSRVVASLQSALRE